MTVELSNAGHETFLHLAGRGAFLEFVEGRALPAVEILEARAR